MMSMKCCWLHKIAMVLVTVGALNWGLVGLGWLVSGADWNVVHMILGSSATLEGIVYVLVGVSAVLMMFACSCKACKMTK